MRKTERLDKILAHMGYGTRSALKQMVRQGLVQINDETASDSGMHVDPESDRITVDGQTVKYRKFIYLILHKPAGYITATEDLRERTVIDLLDDCWRHFHPFPVGRLDKDTEGLLLLTNDGAFAHRLLSPKHKCPKTYVAEVAGKVDDADAAVFARGVPLDDGYVTLPAHLRVLSVSEQAAAPISRVELTIVEGKFHQVKRMFLAVGKRVLYLKRIAMGGLTLDESLEKGEYRELTDEDMKRLVGFCPD